jgi:hypothetical protein
MLVSPIAKAVRGRYPPKCSATGRLRVVREPGRGRLRRVTAAGASPGMRDEGAVGHYDPRTGFRAITTSIAFRWGTPLASEMNSTCLDSTICQSQ